MRFHHALESARAPLGLACEVSSVVEHILHTDGVISSNLILRTPKNRFPQGWRFLVLVAAGLGRSGGFWSVVAGLGRSGVFFGWCAGVVCVGCGFPLVGWVALCLNVRYEDCSVLGS